MQDMTLLNEIPCFDYDINRIKEYCENNLSLREKYIFTGYLIQVFSKYQMEHPETKLDVGNLVKVINLFNEYAKEVNITGVKTVFSEIYPEMFNLDADMIIDHATKIEDQPKKILYLESALHLSKRNPLIECKKFNSAKHLSYFTHLSNEMIPKEDSEVFFYKPVFNENKIKLEIEYIRKNLNYCDSTEKKESIDYALCKSEQNMLHWTKDIDDLVFIFGFLVEMGYLPQKSPYATFIYDNFKWRNKSPNRTNETNRIAKSKENFKDLMKHPSESLKKIIFQLYEEITKHREI